MIIDDNNHAIIVLHVYREKIINSLTIFCGPIDYLYKVRQVEVVTRKSKLTGCRPVLRVSSSSNVQ